MASEHADAIADDDAVLEVGYSPCGGIDDV